MLINKSTNLWTWKFTNQSISQPISQSTNQSIK